MEITEDSQESVNHKKDQRLNDKLILSLRDRFKISQDTLNSENNILVRQGSKYSEISFMRKLIGGNLKLQSLEYLNINISSHKQRKLFSKFLDQCFSKTFKYMDNCVYFNMSLKNTKISQKFFSIIPWYFIRNLDISIISNKPINLLATLMSWRNWSIIKFEQLLFYPPKNTSSTLSGNPSVVKEIHFKIGRFSYSQAQIQITKLLPHIKSILVSPIFSNLNKIILKIFTNNLSPSETQEWADLVSPCSPSGSGALMPPLEGVTQRVARARTLVRVSLVINRE